MIQANALLRADRVFAALFVLTLLGVGLFASLSLLERYLLRWRPNPSPHRIGVR